MKDCFTDFVVIGNKKNEMNYLLKDVEELKCCQLKHCLLSLTIERYFGRKKKRMNS